MFRNTYLCSKSIEKNKDIEMCKSGNTLFLNLGIDTDDFKAIHSVLHIFLFCLTSLYKD